MKHKNIRNEFIWGRRYDRNKNLLSKPENIILKDLSDDHLKSLIVYFKEKNKLLKQSIVNTNKSIYIILFSTLLKKYKKYLKIFKKEIKYRLKHNIKVKNYE